MSAYAEVIGDPVAHSRSPVIHRFWLSALGLDADYRATPVPPAELAPWLAARREDPAWRGCNVTLPHKVAVLDLVDDAAAVRDTIGAANTIVPRDGRLLATNTDAAGFLAPILDLDLAGASVAVVGTGGAARAVLFALRQAGVGEVTVLARAPLKAIALLGALGLKGRAAALDAPLGPDLRLLVNASVLGMVGQPPWTPDVARLAPDAVVYDLVYAPRVTPLLAAAAAHGLATVDGLAMLVEQAALAFALFFDADPPRDHDDALLALLAQ